MKHDEKAQALIMSLWILVVLTVLVISIGHKASFALRLSRYQKDSIKALYLAKAAVNLATVEIAKDNSPDYDSLFDAWADNVKEFKRISLGGTESEFAEVERSPDAYGASDEESKINLNTAEPALLLALLEECGIDDIKAHAVANNILFWRGSVPADTDTVIYYEKTLGYSCKGKPFVVPEELVLVKGLAGVAPQSFEKIKALTTVFGNGKVNINTAPFEVLKIICRVALTQALDKTPGADIKDDDAVSLAQKITLYRTAQREIFKTSDMDTETIRAKLGLDDIATDAKTKILAELIASGKIIAVSNNFRIEATGTVNQVKKRVASVIRRGEPFKQIYWHEE